jgi:3-oxoacid CoA-transferase subunit A
MAKTFKNASEAVADIPAGARILIGGFGICGMPHNLCKALSDRVGAGDLEIVSNAGGMNGWGAGLLFEAKKVKSIIATRVGPACKAYEDQVMNNEIEIELIPQGTFAERIRAGGAGIGGFFTPTGTGTVVADGKESRSIDGREHILEMPIRGDFALIKAWKADETGNLIYRMSARNFNPAMATAAEVTIAEVEEIVPAGELDPERIHSPGIFVQRLVVADEKEKPIEIKTNRPRTGR